MFLATASKRTPPEHKHPIPKHPQARKVSWHRIVVEVALYDRLEPSAGLGHGIVHALTKLLLHQVCQLFCVNGQVLFWGWGAGEGGSSPVSVNYCYSRM